MDLKRPRKRKGDATRKWSGEFDWKRPKESEEMLLALINQMLLAFKIKTPPYIHGFLIFNHSPGLDYLDMLKYINSEKAFVILSK